VSAFYDASINPGAAVSPADFVNTDVLIVGAGPTGLMLANQLARRGVRALIIDRHPGPSLQTRALGVQARTLEIYAKMGLADRAIALGKRGSGAHLWSQGRQIGHVSLSDVGSKSTPYPYILVLGQDDNERIMGEKLRESDVEVEWNTELLAIEQHASHVVATLKSADGAPRNVTAAWVAGCDGARSSVRTLNSIDFPGAPYEHVFFVADVTATGKMAADEVNVYLWPKDSICSFRCAARITGASSASFRRRCASRRIWISRQSCPRCAAQPARVCRSRRAPGSRHISFIIARLLASAIAAASCSATLRTFTVRLARKA